jgi:transketolase
VQLGAYILADADDGKPEVLLLATGSEVALCIDAYEQLKADGWARYVGTTGHSIGMETFGASAPLKELQRKFGFTPESIVAAAKEQVARAG